ncbi:hypothetical protein HC757_06615 [Shewanella sp. SHSM-M6]|uniref:Uncharacterized protein n=2 Tax=Shewanella salipaludis TaxID=2723052 RepID=A0A972FSD7_9GAMM|nr:hypothetical protein [Shewanella salipaludis]
MTVICRCVSVAGLLFLSACAQLHDFPMDASYNQVRQVQILDPGAAERNDGIVLSLEGNYGRRVMVTYRESNVAPATAKDMGKSIISSN